uniref:Uncharacterized protein n=1 Tax=Brassica oleracea var. oleracea TaxID=109376 RepID=A0A0D3CFC6_BRAOL
SSLSLAFEKHSGLSTDVRSQNCCSCLDANNLIRDRGIMTEGLRFSYTMNVSYNVTYSLMKIDSFLSEEDVAEEMIFMIHSFLKRIGQPEVDLANDREEIVPFNVHDATSILEFSSSQMFSMFFRDSLGTTETERNALMLEDFS